MFGDESNSFKVLSFNDTEMFIHSELLNEDMSKPFKVSQFNEMLETKEIEIF